MLHEDLLHRKYQGETGTQHLVPSSPSGATTRRFVGHTKDVLSVAFSADNRQIVSGSRDNTVKLWNTLGVCKYTIQVRTRRCTDTGGSV